ncbi:MAG: isopentenyl phosphate kinase [Candidatus Diapherotrites archaeon]
MKLIILKIGGSVCTYKEENKLEAKEEIIKRIAKEIKEAVKKGKFKLILVHGAGPFGHTNVANFGINNGVYSKKQKEGLEKTIKDCNFLGSIFLKKLNEKGVRAVGLNPNKIIVQEEKKIIKFNLSKIEEALSEGKVPVLYGQMVPDTKLNASVASGDAITSFLSKEFKPEKVLLGTDVNGIFTADPKTNPKAKLIERIDEKNFGEVLKKVEEAKTVDVTQGMKGKLTKLREQLKGTRAIIFNANIKGNVKKALLGERIGTEIKF